MESFYEVVGLHLLSGFVKYIVEDTLRSLASAVFCRTLENSETRY